MTGKTRKVLLLVVKSTLAVVLLGWVFSQVHWSDYVQPRDGSATFAVRGRLTEAGQTRLIVSRGILWWRSQSVRPAADFVPLPGGDEVVRAGFAGSLRKIRVPLAALGALGFGVSLVVIAVRWWLLLRIQDIRIRLWEAIRLTFLGQFFNAVVPGTVGGDLVKAYYVSKHTPKKAAVLVSVFVDRLMGLIELSLLAAVMMAVVLAAGLENFQRVRRPAISISIVLLAVGGVLTFLLSSRFRRALRLERLYQRLPIAHHIAAAGDAARLYRRRIGALARAVLITLGAHACFVGFIALMGTSLSVPTPAYNYFIYVPLIYILGAIPLTPGGVGLVEAFYVDFFQSPQCGASEILVLAMLARLIPIFWGLPGAVVAVTGARLPKGAAIQAELGMAKDAEGL